jgi:hypothetical protein
LGLQTTSAFDLGILMEAHESQRPLGPLLAWLRLFRIPNVFTSLADVLMGFALVAHGFEPLPALIGLLVASALLYTAGMVLNDVFDVEQDARERPERPIPSGRIALGTARLVGGTMLVLGVVCAAVAGYLPGSPAALPWRSAVVGVAIAACVLLYDAVLKRTLLGPLFMGLCRFFNVLLGASLAGVEMLDPRAVWLYYTDGQLLVAGAIAVYVLGITLFARSEAGQSQQAKLTQGLAVMGFGIAMLLMVPRFPELASPRFFFREAWLWPALLMLLTVSIGRHCLNAIMNPEPQRVQMAVKFAILSLISLDAAVTLHAAGPFHALVVFALMLPALALGQWVYST